LGLAHGIYSMVRTLLRINVFALLHADSPVPGLWHLRALPIWFALVNTLAIPIQFLDTEPLKRIGIAGVAVGVLWLYLLDFRYPGFFRRVDRQIRLQQKLQKYQRSSLQGQNVDQLKDRLQRLMEEERVYADEDLSLDRLADLLSVSPGQLSELLNNVIGVDFRSYVNRFRVQEAFSMLMDEPDRKVESIAEAVGFNSRASFFRNFRQITGKTAAMVRAEARTLEPTGERKERGPVHGS
ncbi:MAG: AraC family transcriptional regulator, partial [Leptospiraceae bacterium]|nr:AraC family transcriptional regulator [Leptospiraceae bacterium]